MIDACCEFDPINKNEDVSNKPESSLPVECDNDICYKCRLGKCLEREVHTLRQATSMPHRYTHRVQWQDKR